MIYDLFGRSRLVLLILHSQHDRNENESEFLPSDWPSKYPECAVSVAHKQSPVDIEAKYISDLSKEIFYNQLYGSNMSFIAVNTGHGREYIEGTNWRSRG